MQKKRQRNSDRCDYGADTEAAAGAAAVAYRTAAKTAASSSSRRGVYHKICPIMRTFGKKRRRKNKADFGCSVNRKMRTNVLK